MVKLTIEHADGTVVLDMPETITFVSKVGGRIAEYKYDWRKVTAEGVNYLLVKAMRVFTDGAHTLKKGTPNSAWTEEDFAQRDNDIEGKLSSVYGEEPLPSERTGDKRLSTFKALLSQELRRGGLKKVPALGSTVEAAGTNAVSLGLTRKKVAKALAHSEKIAALYDLE